MTDHVTSTNNIYYPKKKQAATICTTPMLIVRLLDDRQVANRKLALHSIPPQHTARQSSNKLCQSQTRFFFASYSCGDDEYSTGVQGACAAFNISSLLLYRWRFSVHIAVVAEEV